MSLRFVVLALTVAAGAVALSASPPEQNGSPWSDIVARAVAAEKPIVAFSHHPQCPTGSTCGAFIELANHPANRRRLASVLFATTVLEEGDEDSSVSVHSPDGTRLIRWMGIPDSTKFTLMLAGIEQAAPHIVAAHRATSAGRNAEATRETALALLALGYELRARPLLESMRAAENAENRQFATLWLERLDALRSKRLPSDELLTGLARDGVTERVRFEAWMATGDARLDARRVDDAIIAYGTAMELAADPQERQIALDSRQRAGYLASPVFGLGAPGAMVTGRRTVWPRSRPKEAVRVEYRLDDELVAVAKQPPFAMSINFGRRPERHVLKVTASDARGKTLHQTTTTVNDRVDAFSIDIVEPSSSTLSGSVDVVVDVKVPHGLRVESVVVEWNGRRVARLKAPPYSARVMVDAHEQGVLRAAARLEDGSELEDVLLVNSGTMTLETDIHLVEIPAYSEGATAPSRESLKIKEDGAARAVDRVIPATDAPLLISLLIDASWSMTENMLDVQEAAIRFVERNIEPEDRVMVVGFDTQVRILWPTSDRALVERAILSIRASGYTSLNDAMLTAMLQLQSPGWRRALVVFSDGLDNASKFTAGEVSDVARRSAIPIYVLSLRPTPPVGVPGLAERSSQWVFAARTELMKIAWNSGGKVYDLTSLERLDAIWNEIGDDLRKQFLVVYQPAPGSKEWRSIEVLDGRKRLRAPSGLAVATGAATP